ncbi:Ras-like_GTPase superfamily protein [Hexamita inflata]|uniref:Ras-like GTPase superfamily protein n=1 Tax=Hexamita inflata TaxID=28002 RepID=A0AA86UH54_9EUKA|nr:Ras-like GTPase superfamily protein [Hexamita inflata]CAI9951671.1 Ras-like GTPase superfamily protein [Hexamita inflata]
MKDVKQYKGVEGHKTFKVTIIGLPKSGKSTLLYQFAKLSDPFTRQPGYFETLRDERPVTLQTSGGAVNCLFIDNNINDYANARPDQWQRIIADTDCLICMCECNAASVQQAQYLIQIFRQYQNCLTLLVANKSDDYDPDQIKQGQLDGYASQVGAVGLMISAVQGLNFDHLQFIIADLLMNPRQKYGNIQAVQSMPKRAQPNRPKNLVPGGAMGGCCM